MPTHEHPLHKPLTEWLATLPEADRDAACNALVSRLWRLRRSLRPSCAKTHARTVAQRQALYAAINDPAQPPLLRDWHIHRDARERLWGDAGEMTAPIHFANTKEALARVAWLLRQELPLIYPDVTAGCLYVPRFNPSRGARPGELTVPWFAAVFFRADGTAVISRAERALNLLADRLVTNPAYEPFEFDASCVFGPMINREGNEA